MRDRNLRRLVHKMAKQLGMYPIGFKDDEDPATVMSNPTVAEGHNWSGVNVERVDLLRRDVDLILEHLGVEIKYRDRGPAYELARTKASR